MKEVWRPVRLRGWSKLYEVSNTGRVRSLDRIVYQSHPKRPELIYPYLYRGRVLRQGIDRDGYALVVFCKNKVTRKTVKVHHLVAEVFCHKRKRGNEVNHKDFNRSNNMYKNLEWMSRKENSQYTLVNGRGRWGIRYHAQ